MKQSNHSGRIIFHLNQSSATFYSKKKRRRTMMHSSSLVVLFFLALASGTVQAQEHQGERPSSDDGLFSVSVLYDLHEDTDVVSCSPNLKAKLDSLVSEVIQVQGSDYEYKEETTGNMDDHGKDQDLLRRGGSSSSSVTTTATSSITMRPQRRLCGSGYKFWCNSFGLFCHKCPCCAHERRRLGNGGSALVIEDLEATVRALVQADDDTACIDPESLEMVVDGQEQP
mmetsp:Transcript_23329/g.41810  ORF Transcript_23329/g.41810 Transcript_23329/m.41810 type:complete len:227 (-) Transcript_23329:136-816(-)